MTPKLPAHIEMLATSFRHDLVELRESPFHAGKVANYLSPFLVRSVDPRDIYVNTNQKRTWAAIPIGPLGCYIEQGPFGPLVCYPHPYLTNGGSFQADFRFEVLVSEVKVASVRDVHIQLFAPIQADSVRLWRQEWRDHLSAIPNGIMPGVPYIEAYRLESLLVADPLGVLWRRLQKTTRSVRLPIA